MAGIKLCAEVRKKDPFVPLIIQSSETENAAYAAKYGATFIDKNSKKMDVDFAGLFPIISVLVTLCSVIPKRESR